MRFKYCKKGCQVVSGLASAEQFPHGERDTFGWNSNVVTWCYVKWWFRKGVLKSSENYPAFQAIGGCLRWPGCVAMNIQMAPGGRRSSCKPNMWEKEIRRCSKRVNVGSCGGAGWCCGCCAAAFLEWDRMNGQEQTQQYSLSSSLYTSVYPTPCDDSLSNPVSLSAGHDDVSIDQTCSQSEI